MNTDNLKETNKQTPSYTNDKSALGIRGRLFIGFGILTAIFIISIIINLIIVTTSKNSAERVINNDLPTFDAFLNLGADVYRSQAALRGWVINDNPDFKKEYDNSFIILSNRERDLDNLSKGWMNTEMLNNWQQIKLMLGQIKDQHNQLANITDTKSNPALVSAVTQTTNTLLNKLMDVLDGPMNISGDRTGGMYDTQYNKLEEGSKNIIADMTMIQVVAFCITLIVILAAIFIVLSTSRSIIRHINVFRQYSNRIASGDLRQTLTIKGHDEIAELGVDLNSMTTNLATITKQIAQASHNMVSTLEEVKQAVGVQSSGATEQASSINEITASLEEIEKSSAQTMEKAKSLGDVAERTQSKGKQGLESVEQSILGMKAVRDKVQMIAQTILELSNQTQQVGEITSAVNNLAQQSKMLALNASIEAAKAGEAGKGFAVVASEVKNLAEQSEQSTTQVQKILEDIRQATEKAVMATEEGTKGVDQGTSLVEQTGEIVRGLSDLIHEATMASQQIEAAVRQEGVGIEQITAGMNEINQVTASFVASAHQTLEAISNLASISKELKEQVDVYKV